ncbi:MAG: hypothetical protein WCG04_00590 [Alphaproteobacteria bacterium]
MRIDRGLRAAIATAYPAGYRAPTPTSLNTEPGRVVIAPQGGIAQEDLNGPPFPESIALMVRLQPQRTLTPIRIGLDAQHRPLLLYDEINENFSHACVQLLYHGLGKVQWNNGGNDCSFQGVSIGPLRLTTVGENGVVFEKKFLHQIDDLHLRKEAMRNIYPLWSHGGFFEPGCSIEAIEQGVFTLGADASISVSPLSFWKNKTTTRSGTDIHFLNDFRPKHWRNLAGDIESGQVRIDLCYGIDERGEAAIQIYRSFRFTQRDLSNGILEVFFIKE